MTKEEFQEQFALIEKMCQEAAQYRDYNPTMAVRVRCALTILREEPDNKEWCEEHLQKQDFMACSKELVVRWNKSLKSTESTESTNEAEDNSAPILQNPISDNDGSVPESDDSVHESDDSVPENDNSVPEEDENSSSANSVDSVDFNNNNKPRRRGRKE